MTFPSTAATVSWDGSDSTAWSTGGNWTGDVAPANSLLTDVVLFNLGIYANQPDAGTTAINGIQIGSSSGALTVDGTLLSIGSSGIVMSSGAAAATINAPITLGAAQTWANNSTNTLSVGSIAPISGAGTAVNFTGTGVIKTTNANTNDILGAWATTGMAGTNNATGDWATVNGSGNIVAYTAYTDITGATSGAGATTQNWRTTNNAASLTASATVNSLVMTTDFNIQSGATLTLGSGGMILSGASKWLKNNGAGSAAGTGQITSGLASGELFIHSSGSSATNNDWRIWTKIVDNGGTAVKLVKNGPGFLDLQSANTYTGGTIINGGELSVSNNGALGTGALSMKGGTLSIEKAGGNIDLANSIALSGINKIQTDVARNLTLTSASTVTGNGTLTLGESGANASIFLNATNSMTGGTIVMANNTNAQRISSTSFGNANVAWVFNNVTANKTTLDFSTGTVSFGSMTGAGRIQGNNATGTKTISAGALGLNDTFSGVIANGAGTVALTKVGSGTMTLSGANTYTGKTTISGGSLALASGGSIASSSEIALNGGNLNVSSVIGFSTGASQSFTGVGSVTGDIVVAGNLAIGSNSAGTIIFNDDLTIGGTAVSNFEFTSAALGVGTWDLAQGGAGAQAVTFGGTLNLFFSGGTYGNSSVQIFDFESFSGNFTTVNFNGLGAGQSAVFNATTGFVTVVPEPKAALIGGIGMLALLRRRRD